MYRRNRGRPHDFDDRSDSPGQPRFVSPEGRSVPRSDLWVDSRADYGPYQGDDEFVIQVRQQVRLITELARGTDEEVTAPVLSSSRHSRLIKDVVKLLNSSRHPLVLLGEPGSGKSTVLQEVALRYARKALKLGIPRLPIYVVLGTYTAVDREGRPGDVLSLIRQAIPPAFAGIRSNLDVLLKENRLAVFFDGMDEMDRDLYTERIQALSEFALLHISRAKTIFACRIANFSPAFIHRQVVLLPFSAAKIRDYVKKNFPKSVLINGSPYTQKKVADRLLASDSFQETARLPLTLYLFRYYVIDKKRWPERRHELFGTYVDFLCRRLKMHYGPGRSPDKAQVLDAWEALAYHVMVQKQGTCLTSAGMSDFAASIQCPELAEWGERSGLLRPELGETERPEDAQITFRFSHHQIQEYLAARYMLRGDRSHEAVLDWSQLIDNPRWQETLIHAASIQPATLPALSILETTYQKTEDSFAALDNEKTRLEAEHKRLSSERSAIEPDWTSHSHEGADVDHYSAEKTARLEELWNRMEANKREQRGLPFKIEPERERTYADRVVLGSQLFREAGAVAEPFGSSFTEHYRRAVKRLVRQGRPTSQVKMLWAFRNAPAISERNDINTAFRSPITWVRDQAIAVVGGLVRVSSLSAQMDLEQEVLVDLSRGQFLAHLKAYLRASKRPSWLLTVALALVCWAALNLGTAGLSFLAILLPLQTVARYFNGLAPVQLPLLRLMSSAESRAVLGFALATVLVFFSAVIHGRPLIRRLPLTCGLAGTILLWLHLDINNLFVEDATDVEQLVRIAKMFLLFSVPWLLAGAGTWALNALVWRLYAIPVRLARGKWDSERLVAQSLQSHESASEPGTLIAGLCGTGIAGFFAFLAFLFSVRLRRFIGATKQSLLSFLSRYHLSPLMVISAIVVVGYAWLARWWAARSKKSVYKVVGSHLAFALVVAGAGAVVRWLYVTSTLRFVVLAVLSGMALVGYAAFVSVRTADSKKNVKHVVGADLALAALAIGVVFAVRWLYIIAKLRLAALVVLPPIAVVLYVRLIRMRIRQNKGRGYRLLAIHVAVAASAIAISAVARWLYVMSKLRLAARVVTPVIALAGYVGLARWRATRDGKRIYQVVGIDLALAGSVVGIGAVGRWLYLTSELRAAVLVVVSALAGLGYVQFARWRARHNNRSIFLIVRNDLALALLLVAAGALGRLILSSVTPALWGRVGAVLRVLALWLVAGLIVYWWTTSSLFRFHFGRILRRRNYPQISANTPEEWERRFKEANEFRQAIMIEETTQTTMRQTAQEFLLMLERCEVDVQQREPALTSYWRKRHDLEEILKQQRFTASA